jgi:hypothetical protein
MGQTVRSQKMLRRLAMIDEGFVEDQAGLGLDPASKSALDPRRRRCCGWVSVAIGSLAVCLEWSTQPGAGGGRG